MKYISTFTDRHGKIRHCGEQSRERKLHRIFGAFRVRGEWFYSHEDIRRYAGSTNEEQRLTILSNLEKMAEIREDGDPNGIAESAQNQRIIASNHPGSGGFVHSGRRASV